MLDELKQDVRESADWLDEHWPIEPEWWKVLDFGTLNMGDPAFCVLGQLGAALARTDPGLVVDEINRIGLSGLGPPRYTGFGAIFELYISGNGAVVGRMIRDQLGAMSLTSAHVEDEALPHWRAEVRNREMA